MKLLYICIVFLFAMLICFRVVLEELKTPQKPKNTLKKAIFEFNQKAPTLQARQSHQKSTTLEMPPEIENLKTLCDQIKTQPAIGWDKLLAIADMYHKGAYPRFAPNKTMAAKIYEAIATTCTHSNLANIAHVKYAEISVEGNDVDIHGNQLPVQFGEDALHAILNYKPSNNSFLLWQKPPQTPKTTFKSDLQNVHDHSVLSIVKKNIDAYKSTPGIIEHIDCRDNVRHDIVINNNISHEEKFNAIKALDSISKKKNPRFGVSELEVLNVVWGRIQATPSEDKRTNLAEMLTKQLASAIENGFVVCSSGKISRLIGTFDGIDDQPQSRPLWALNEEIAHLANQVREKHISKLTSHDPDGVIERMKDDFRSTVLKEYVETLGMDKTVLDPMIDSYLCGF